MQAELADGLVELGEHDAGLDAGEAALGIDRFDLGHVAGEIEHDGVIDALAGEAGAAAAWEDGRAVVAGDGDGCGRVGGAAGEDDSDGLHLVERGVGGVEQAGGAVDQEVGLSAQRVAQVVGQPLEGGRAFAQERAGAFDAGVRRAAGSLDDGADGHVRRLSAMAAAIARAAAAGLAAPRMAERTATPCAPAAMASAAFWTVMPPIA